MNAKEMGRVPLSAADIVSIVKQLATGKHRGRRLKIQHPVTNQVSWLVVEDDRLHHSHMYGSKGVGDVSDAVLMLENRADAWLVLGLTAENDDTVDADVDLEVMLPHINGAMLVMAHAKTRRTLARLLELMAEDVAKPADFKWQNDVRELMAQAADVWGDAAKAGASIKPRRTDNGKT